MYTWIVLLHMQANELNTSRIWIPWSHPASCPPLPASLSFFPSALPTSLSALLFFSKAFFSSSETTPTICVFSLALSHARGRYDVVSWRLFTRGCDVITMAKLIHAVFNGTESWDQIWDNILVLDGIWGGWEEAGRNEMKCRFEENRKSARVLNDIIHSLSCKLYRLTTRES